MSDARLIFSEKTNFESFEKLFGEAFPRLRLQLVRIKSANGQNSSPPSIIITENMTVAEMENEFRFRFGIAANLYRLTAGCWIAVKQSRDWSLRDQNTEGGLV